MAGNDRGNEKNKAMGAQLTSSEFLSDDFSDLSCEWSWQTDSSLILVHLGRSFERLTGHNPAELLGQPVMDVFARLGDAAWMDVPALICALQSFIGQHQPFDDLEIVLDGRGRECRFALKGRPCSDENGVFRGYRGIARKIDVREQAGGEAVRIGELHNDLLEGLDALGDGFTLFDAEGRLVLCNETYRRMYPEIAELIRPGVRFEELLRASAERGAYVFDTGIDDWVRERLARHHHPQGAFDQRHPSGRWLRIVERKTRSGGIVSVRTDITRLKERERSLQRSEKRFVEALESISEGFVLFDAEDRLVFCNSQYRDIYSKHSEIFERGKSFEELLRAGVARGQFDIPDGGEEEWIAERVRAHQNPQGAIIQRLSDGRVILVRESRTPTGEIIGIRSDITEVYAIQAELRKLGEAVSQVANAIFITDTDGMIEYVNPAVTAITGYAQEDLIGKTPRILNSGQTPECVYRELWKTIRRGEVWRGKLLNRRKDGALYWSEQVISPVRNADGAITNFIAVQQDVTEQVRLNQALVQAREKAEEADRAKTEFLANMSHELRTPLNAIIGFSELMQTEPFGPLGAPQYKEYAGDILKSGRHLLAIIGDILDLSRVEAGITEVRAEDIDFIRLIEDSLVLIGSRFAHAGSISIEKHFDTLPPYRGDPRLLRQVLVNLLSNAFKFMPDGGTCTIEAKMTAGGKTLIRICDTGIGMSEEDIRKAMERFGQAESSMVRNFEGLGLGLPLSKSFVELHGGTLEIDSTPGQGTCISILLP